MDYHGADLMNPSKTLGTDRRHLTWIAGLCLTVIALIVNQQLEVLLQKLPERIVCVGGETVAVAEQDALTVWVAVLTDANDGTVGHSRVQGVERRWNDELGHQRARVQAGSRRSLA